MFRGPNAAPEGAVAEERRGRRVGRFCHGCGGVYSLHGSRHNGKGLCSRDHVSPPCSHEGERFEEGASWWEEAVEVLPETGSAD